MAPSRYRHGYYIFQWCTDSAGIELSRDTEPAFMFDYMGASLERFEQRLADTYLPRTEKLYMQAYMACQLIEEQAHGQEVDGRQFLHQVYSLVNVFRNGALQHALSGLRTIFEEGVIQLPDVREGISGLMTLIYFVMDQADALRYMVVGDEQDVFGYTTASGKKCLRMLNEIRNIQDSFLKDLKLLEKEILNPVNCLMLN